MIREDEHLCSNLKNDLNISSINQLSKRVFLCKDFNDQCFIIKHTRTYENSELQDNESKVYEKLKCKYLGNFLESLKYDGVKYLKLEYLGENDLFNIMKKRMFKPFSEKESNNLFNQIIKGLEYCHNNGIIHRDVKLENIILTRDFVIKIIDFELCCFVKNCCEEKTLNCGTIGYYSPQIRFKKSYPACSADVWSLVKRKK